MTDLTKAVAQAYLEMQEAKKKKLDAVDKSELEGEFDDREDKDLDNDGDTDKSDKYLHNRRKTVSKAMEKDGKGEKSGKMDEAKDLNTDNAAKALEHDCATHVQHEEYGLGKCIPGQHTLVAIDETHGYVTHYDVQFEHGIVEDVAVEDLKIISEMSHGHPRKKKKGMRESFADHSGYYVAPEWEVVQENEDGTFDAFIDGELHHNITEEMAKELKHKNVAKAQPEGQEKLDMKRTKGEEEFVNPSVGGETIDNPEKEKQDGATMSQAPKRGTENRSNEPMKSVAKVQGQ